MGSRLLSWERLVDVIEAVIRRNLYLELIRDRPGALNLWR